MSSLDSAVNICLLNEQSEKSKKDQKHKAEVFAIQDHCINWNRYQDPAKLKCYAFNKQCNSCGKWNHFAKCCRSAPSSITAPQSQSRDYHPKRTTAQFRGSKSNWVNELDTTLNAPEDTYYCETVDLHRWWSIPTNHGTSLWRTAMPNHGRWHHCMVAHTTGTWWVTETGTSQNLCM